jgi:hypothetical protein
MASSAVCSRFGGAQGASGIDPNLLKISELKEKSRTVREFLSKAHGQLQQQLDTRIET